MTKKFTVYSAFGNGPTVHRNVFGMFSMGKGVYDFWNGLLTNTAFPGNQYGNVRWCHLNGLFNGTIKFYIIANDFKALFY